MLGPNVSRSLPLWATLPPLLSLLIVSVLGCSGPSQRPPANFGPSPSVAPPAPDSSNCSSIRALLRQQERAWNRGNLDAFMAGYARSDTLRLASGGTVRTGWEETMARYRRSYPDQAAMGTLSFSDLSVQLLSGRHALAFGHWRLERGGAASQTSPSQGLFTLLFEKVTIDDGRAWRIVHDHTSSD